MYYRESFEYSLIKIFMNSNSADTKVNRGNLIFNFKNTIRLQITTSIHQIIHSF